MCGIAGIFSYGDSAPPVDRAELLRIRETMVRRGPDGAGLWISNDEKIGLAHQRLAIIDLSDAGAQPMHDHEGDLCIVFNGEIYNYKELRSDLEARGHQFQSKSDTEVLLLLYREFRQEMVQRLRGMYAFVIFDRKHQVLFLARDPLGIKPLYYSDNGHTLRFASQVKALTASNKLDAASDIRAHLGFLLWGYVPEPFTTKKSIKAVPAGSFLWVNRNSGASQPHSYFSIRDECIKAEQESKSLTPEEHIEHAIARLRDSVKYHMVSDVPVGVFLSAGRDSSLISAMASSMTASPLRTLTLGFAEFTGTALDEVPCAEMIAATYGTVHQTIRVTRQEFEGSYNDLLTSMDQPSIDGINSYFVSKHASASGLKVVLSGLGGDELFGGYPSYRQIPRLVSSMRHLRSLGPISNLAQLLWPSSFDQLVSPKWAGLFNFGPSYGGAYLLRRGLYMPWELERMFGKEVVRAGLRDLQPLASLEDLIRGIRTPSLRVLALEMSMYMRNQLLRDSDWAGMSHSLEIRLPFVDVDLIRAWLPVAGHALPIDRQAVIRSACPEIASALEGRQKTGFSMPVREWLSKTKPAAKKRRGLRGWAVTTAKHFFPVIRPAVVLTDGYGGIGGIAKFNRDLLQSLAANPACDVIKVFPRIAPIIKEPIPPRIDYHLRATTSKFKFAMVALRSGIGNARINLVICGHINLILVAWLISVLRKCPLVLVVHGIDAWTPHKSFLVRRLLHRVDSVIAVSAFTAERFRRWSGVKCSKFHLLPNCVNLTLFSPRSKRDDLVKRYGLQNQRVLLTVGRLVSAERYKGFDEVLDILPDVLMRVPNLRYLIAGDGDDRARLEQKAKSLGLENHVVFSGYVVEEEKADHYALADVYVMPSRGEGFGIVFLEAMACGIPVIASKADGGREALLDGKLGRLVDPNDRNELKSAIYSALLERRRVPDGLDAFSYPAFEKRVASVISAVSG